MNSKTLLAALAMAIVSFLAGWAVWGMALQDFMKDHTIQYEGLMREEEDMVFWAFIVANIIGGILYTWILVRTGATTLGKGAVTAACVSLAVTAMYDLYFYGSMNLSDSTAMLVDIAASTIVAAVVGGIGGAILGSGKKAAA